MGDVRALLESTPMHQLQGKLSEYGVEDAFKHGMKKAQIIDEAIRILEKQNAEPEEGIVEDEETVGNEEPTPKVVDPVEEKKENDPADGFVNPEAKDPAIESKPSQESSPASIEPEQEKPFVMSETDIKRNITNCKLNLIGAEGEKKKFLLDKITELEAKLK